MRIRPAVICAALLVALSAPAQAHAQPVEHLHGEVSNSGSSDDCGFTIESDFTAEFHVLLREVRESDGQAYLGHENFRFEEVLTNPATGEWFVIHGVSLFKELSGRQIEGDVWEFTVHEVGLPFVVEDSDGNVVLRDRGRISLRAVFDTLGDGQPGGILLEEEITGVRGPHPAIDVDFCALATDLIG